MQGNGTDQGTWLLELDQRCTTGKHYCFCKIRYSSTQGEYMDGDCMEFFVPWLDVMTAQPKD